MRGVSKAESIVCKRLRPLLAALPCHAAIDASDDLCAVLSALEYFVPEVLREVYPEWKNESLDGVEPYVARKLGDNEMEIVGHCILLSDRTLAPLHLCLQLDTTDDVVSWLECRLGESTAEGMQRTPYAATPSMKFVSRLESMDWRYVAGYGERRTVT
jgi:hypothetical protein